MITNLEKEMATHSSILTWESPWSEEPGGLEPIRSQKSQTGLRNSAITTMITSSDMIGRWFEGCSVFPNFCVT